MRTMFRWKVTLQRDDGEVVEREVRAYWDPEHDTTADGVGVTAKAEAWWASKKKHQFAVLAVARAGPIAA